MGLLLGRAWAFPAVLLASMACLAAADGGIVIAEVQADLAGPGVTVETHESFRIYQSTKQITISGNGFVDGVQVRFANALREGTNFTITDTQPKHLTLDLAEGSLWQRNSSSLPGALVLLAAKADDGWVPLGPTAAKAGRKVATVFEDPSLEASDVKIYRTRTHELLIKGTGFNNAARPLLDFEPAIYPFDTFVDVVNGTMIRLSLSSTSSKWTSFEQIGALTVRGMNTGAGMVMFDAPVTVATVLPDADMPKSVEVYPAYCQPKYQSSKESLTVLGAGFKGEPVLSFEPPIWSPANYTLTVVSETELKLDLVAGSMWNKLPGQLMVKDINVGDGVIQLAQGKGVRVATILEDPSIQEADRRLYATHTKHFAVRGAGFFSVQDPSRPPIIVIDGISAAKYKVQDHWHNSKMTLELLDGGSWGAVSEGATVDLKIMSIDTGAGLVSFPLGVQIAHVTEDGTAAVCEDSCTFAYDGQCDEPGIEIWHHPRYGETDLYNGKTFHEVYPCDIGTDCTDCGIMIIPEGACLNTCQRARDGYCDDPRSGGVCPSGTDCQDCGPWGDSNSNFTETTLYTSSLLIDDAGDDGILYRQEMIVLPVHKRGQDDRNIAHKEAAGAGTIFAVVDVVWAMVVLVGFSASLAGCFAVYRHFKIGGGA